MIITQITMLPQLLRALLLAGISGASIHDHRGADPIGTMPRYRADEPILRGEAIGSSPVVALREVIRNPARYAGRTVIIEGRIRGVCQKKGCWMEISGRGGGLRVTFKDYGFFVPKDSKGKRVRAEGIVEVKTLSKADADHLAGEGARIRRNRDGTATEIGFVASGVEIRAGRK